MDRLEQFFDRYYVTICIVQPDEWKDAYCKGAREMFEGLVAELGMKVVQEKGKQN
jgi:hypothetical protein